MYAGIDAYSRRLLWAYTGISNRTQISVVKQFCVTVQIYNVFPRIVRSDRGVETAIMADVQYSLGVYDKHRQGLTPVDRRGEPLDEWPLNEFYVYGTSSKNIRIESWWGQLRRGQTGNLQVWYCDEVEVAGAHMSITGERFPATGSISQPQTAEPYSCAVPSVLR